VIRPQKHLRLDVCVLRITATLLAHLQRRRVESFANLHDLATRELGADASVQFLPALNLLFLLGKIRYHPHQDRIEFIETS